jgi:hypothetical protein
MHLVSSLPSFHACHLALRVFDQLPCSSPCGSRSAKEASVNFSRGEAGVLLINSFTL